MSDLLVRRSDAREFRRRFRWFALAVLGGFLLLLGRAFQLQVVEGDAYRKLAHDNIVRRVKLPTTRGVIRDRKGRVLASSRPAYNVLIVPGRAMPSARPPKRAKRASDDADTWPAIADALRLNPEEKTQIEAKIRAACVTDEDRSPCWRGILVREDLPRDLIAEIKQHPDRTSGALIVQAPVRYYPNKSLGAHAVGYVSEISAEQLSKVRPEGYETMTPNEREEVNPRGYTMGDRIGATGIERALESELRGTVGWEKRVADARGRYRTGPDIEALLDPPVRREPIPGNDAELTIDLDLVKIIDRAMRDVRAGAVVVTEVNTGRLLATYSKPQFDPNELAGGRGRDRIREAFTRLSRNPLRPLLDKTVSGAFHPGSTFKPFAALAALEDHLLEPEDTEDCEGFLDFGRRRFRCTHVHHRVDMRTAVAASCNVYFFKLAESVGMDRLAEMGRQFGLGERTGLDLNPETAGRMPTRSWYALRYRGQYRIGFTLNAAIGQGATTASPLQLAMAYAALANGGTLYEPQIVEKVRGPNGNILHSFKPRVRRKIRARRQNLALIREALEAVVLDPRGTANEVRDETIDIAGKTGTAQTPARMPDNVDAKEAWYFARDHAWFAAYAPTKRPKIALIVLVEHGGSGPTVAAPIAMRIVHDYLGEAHPEAAKKKKDKAKAGALAKPGGQP